MSSKNNNLKSPEKVLNDLIKFISETYTDDLPNSLLVAQEFLLKYPEYGKEFWLSEINSMIENGIKKGIFK